MPCLDEAETVGTCIRKAREAIEAHDLVAEIIVADNGSRDGSREIASSLGARVVPVETKGYGAALLAGIAAARGRYVIMADADDSYDFRAIFPFVERLRESHDLVMGNRFAGGILPGAMPWKHRWIGNPILTAIGRLFFRSRAGDFHCGMRGFSREAFERMELRTTGMELASEMVIKATLKGMAITEVPVVLSPAGRTRPPHLRSWRDGWRHLRFMLLFSPRWLFLLPGVVMLVAGSLAAAILTQGPVILGGAVLDIHTLLVAVFIALLGFQLVVFAVFAKAWIIREGLHPSHSTLDRFRGYVSLESGVFLGIGFFAVGLLLLGFAVAGWSRVEFGQLDPRQTMRQVIPAVGLMMLGAQVVFASFLLSVLALKPR
ncbi:MAG TPA: glycosyltransferase family 2 protein [Thermoanaerobaculia bacterium]|nr:glycosyltransferase family 2 protein [Thermoanaerobaculia bacterium]